LNSQTFKQLRILILLVILLVVSLNTWLDRTRSTDWDRPLWVVIYPINGDGSKQSEDYLSSLTREDFTEIEDFFHDESERYGLLLEQPVTLRLAPTLNDDTPSPPEGDSVLASITWSLKMRYWAWQHEEYGGPLPDIRIFLRYHDPQRTDRVAHSLGLQKGLTGVVNAYADRDYREQNQVVITHELLHTLGALDKYHLDNNQPLFPVGYAEPDKQPLYPQSKAEVMGGRIPLGRLRAEMPDGLKQVVIGPLTADEINWTAPEN
jgi:hypothetical protein